jgi:hypothetical protein
VPDDPGVSGAARENIGAAVRDAMGGVDAHGSRVGVRRSV